MAEAMTPRERQEYIDGLALREQRKAALGLAPVTGDTLHDASAARDRATEIEDLWTRLDDLARSAEYEAGPFPAPETVAEVRRLRADAESAWQARQAAVAQRDALEARLEGRTAWQDEAEAERFYRLMESKRAQRDRKPDIRDTRR